jgi:hypothetical protein
MLLPLFLLLALPAAVRSQNLVQNGSFQTGDFTGWTLSGWTDYTFVDNGSLSGIPPYSTNQYEAVLGTEGPTAYLSQMLSTTAGANYLITFWLDNPNLFLGQFLVSWGGNTLLDQTSPGSYDWALFSFVVSATGPSTVLQFGSEANYGFLGLDDISVVSLEPWPFTFTVNNGEDGAITITGYTGSVAAVTSVIIPSTFGSVPVTGIGASAFQGCTSLTNLTIPASVTSIGASAFQGCTSLTNVTIPASVTSIGEAAFWGCFSLTNLSIGANVANIGEYAFGNCVSLPTVTIPASVTSIGDQAFVYCSSLTAITVDPGNPAYSSVAGVLFNQNQTTLIQYPTGSTATSYTTMPNTVTSIADSAFTPCSSLTTVTIGPNVTSIGYAAFDSCTSLASVMIPNSVTSIGELAFAACFSLTNLTLGANVTSIGEQAFIECSSLPSITIPASVTSIGGAAFDYCSSLMAITVVGNNHFYSSAAGVLFNQNQTTLIQYPIGNAATSYTTMPNAVTSIGDDAFADCTNLTSVTIGPNVTSIGYYSFGGCGNLASVTIGAKVASIGEQALSGCISLASVIIPASVTSIGAYAFYDCPSLTAITVDPSNPAYSSVAGVLFNKNQTTLIQYPIGNAATSYSIPNTVTNIGDGAFYDCTSLTSVTIPASVTSIGDYAFYGCPNLTAVYAAGSLPTMGVDVFGDPPTIYYLPGATGWAAYAAASGIPIAVWLPQALTSDGSFGVLSNQFGFNITWASGMVVVVEASTNLANPVWSPLQTNTLTASSLYFSDPQWTNYPARFYRLSVP